MSKKVVKVDLLGSTGSIGEQAIDVARKIGADVSCLCANKNYKRVEEQAREFKPAFCAMYDYDAAKSLQLALADTDIKVFCGEEGICEMIAASNAEVSLNAIIGEAGLLPTLEIIKNKKKLALANKESLVVAGDIVMSAARDNQIKVTPVDSEHCAIHQCLRSGKNEEVKKLIVTASGGPFFGFSAEKLEHVTAKNALAHPTWSMGAKITIDSATLMNKGFELIEASHLFGIDIDKIEAIVHRESIIHSMVEYIDNSVIAQMSVPDMRYCIQYGICDGERLTSVIDELDLAKISKLSFYEPDYENFPLLGLAIDCKRRGGALPAVLNAANEIAVEAFLNDKLSFRGISDTVIATVDKLARHSESKTLDEILNADREAREYAKSLINR